MYVAAAKRSIMSCLNLPPEQSALLTTNHLDANIHAVRSQAMLAVGSTAPGALDDQHLTESFTALSLHVLNTCVCLCPSVALFLCVRRHLSNIVLLMTPASACFPIDVSNPTRVDSRFIVRIARSLPKSQTVHYKTSLLVETYIANAACLCAQVPMRQVTLEAMESLLLRYKGRYTAVVGFKPTGWSHAGGSGRNGQGAAAAAAAAAVSGPSRSSLSIKPNRRRSQRGTVVMYQVGGERLWPAMLHGSYQQGHGLCVVVRMALESVKAGAGLA